MLDKLKQLGACRKALGWVESHKDLTPQQLWDSCPDGSWLLWLLAKTQADHKKIVLCAARCARLSLQYNDDPRVIAAIETVEAFANGKATVEDCRKAADAAYAAADAAYAAADAAAADAAVAANAVIAAWAADATYVAANAAGAARSAAYSVAADATHAAQAATHAAQAAATYAAYATTLKQCADIVREVFPDVPVI